MIVPPLKVTLCLDVGVGWVGVKEKSKLDMVKLWSREQSMFNESKKQEKLTNKMWELEFPQKSNLEKKEFTTKEEIYD